MIAEIKISKDELEKILRAYLKDKIANIIEVSADITRDYGDSYFEGMSIKVEL